MKKTVLVLAAAVLSAAAAHAGTIYLDFAYSGPGVNASGVLTATTVAPDEYLITGVTGQRNGTPITAFLYPTTGAPGSLVYISNGSSIDNLLFLPPLPGPFSNWNGTNDSPSGFVFQTKDGQFNPYTTNGVTYEYNLSVGGSGYGIPIQFSATPEAPEPATLALLGSGLLGLGRLARRRVGRAGRARAGVRINDTDVANSLKTGGDCPIG
ncbi:MAG: PEP-CTERM sorting domain-containing protein [Bryobacteraceae bacterium]|jgi:hypothetical protein